MANNEAYHIFVIENGTLQNNEPYQTNVVHTVGSLTSSM